jgi:hypothetical protein
LGAGASQPVTVGFSPTGATNYSQSVTFTGGNGTNTTVTGSATNAPPILPTVSAINVNATDVDLSLPGLQIYAGTTVQFSAHRHQCSDLAVELRCQWRDPGGVDERHESDNQYRRLLWHEYHRQQLRLDAGGEQ